MSWLILLALAPSSLQQGLLLRKHERVILGIDEAGRGPVLGPLVVCGVALRPQAASALTRRGVADSKEFGAGAQARERRAELGRHIERLADDIHIEVFEHDEVDRYCDQGLLNELERIAATRIIDRSVPVRRIIADGEKVFGGLQARYPHLEARNFGEKYHVSVAAASILAKVARDERFSGIAARYDDEFGPIRGGGYVNAATADFLRRYYARYRCFPEETRRSWGWKVLTELEPRLLPLFE